ncbi:hypothetical protein Bca101_053598 [Brassica carinata]
MTEVVVHIYDVTNSGSEKTNNTILQINRFFKDGIGLGGIFHSAIQVYGDEEWSYGYCEQGTGVFSCPSTKNPMYTYRWVNRFAHAGDTALEVAGNTAMRVKQAKTELVSASKVAYRFLSNITSNVTNGSPQQRPGTLGSSENGSLRLQGSWFKGLLNTAKPSTSTEIEDRDEDATNHAIPNQQNKQSRDSVPIHPTAFG